MREKRDWVWKYSGRTGVPVSAALDDDDDVEVAVADVDWVPSRSFASRVEERSEDMISMLLSVEGTDDVDDEWSLKESAAQNRFAYNSLHKWWEDILKLPDNVENHNTREWWKGMNDLSVTLRDLVMYFLRSRQK